MENPFDPALLLYVTGATSVLNLFINWLRKGAPSLPSWVYLVVSIVLSFPLFWCAMVLGAGPLEQWGQVEFATLFVGGMLTAGGAQVLSSTQQSADTARAVATKAAETGLERATSDTVAAAEVADAAAKQQ